MTALGDIAGQTFDAVVIGGGINGAGVAREAQLAGYRTLLVERDDFGAGTTSRSTRLIHGGLRYLEHRELGLVYESLAERAVLVREMPHLVRPLRLLLPVYEGDRRPAWKVRAGLALYDALSFRKSLPRHRAVLRRNLVAVEPRLRREGLRAAYTFFDAQVQFPERIVVETVREFVEAGGIALNHTAAARLLSPGGRVRGVVLRASCGGEGAEVQTSAVVDAAGPWADAVLAGSDAERHEPLIGGTKGSHLVVEWRDGPTGAIFATARADGRPFFILPWYRYTLIGTTDLRYDGDPSEARATPEEVRYLLDEANRLAPGSPLTEEQILYTYCGVRPLPFTTGGDESSITRRHLIIDQTRRGGPSGLLVVVGGKLTTYRSLARVAVPHIAKYAKPSASPVQPRAAAPPAPEREQAGDALALYGSRRAEVEELLRGEPVLRERICEHHPETLAQVAYAVEREFAQSLGDVLLRRLPVGWSRCHALDGVEAVAGVMTSRLGWDAERTRAEIAAYADEVERVLVPLGRL
ncbi:MAG: glycerol-3-phosphate dehydrogenase/oxidase [Dehalococcoidia bacterium]